MKVFSNILKILAALAAIAGVVYVVINYGDRIVAWVKDLLGRCGCNCGCETCDCGCDEDCDQCTCEYDCDTQCPCENEEIPEAPAQEPAVEAEEADFEGE